MFLCERWICFWTLCKADDIQTTDYNTDKWCVFFIGTDRCLIDHGHVLHMSCDFIMLLLADWLLKPYHNHIHSKFTCWKTAKNGHQCKHVFSCVGDIQSCQEDHKRDSEHQNCDGYPFFSLTFNISKIPFLYLCHKICLSSTCFFSGVISALDTRYMTADFTCFFFSGVVNALATRYLTADLTYFFFSGVVNALATRYLTTDSTCCFFSGVVNALDTRYLTADSTCFFFSGVGSLLDTRYMTADPAYPCI